MDEDQIIDIPGVGPIGFPSTMTKEQIDAAARKLYYEANPNHKTARTEDFMPHDPSNIFTKRPDMTLMDGVVEGLGSVAAMKGAAKQVGSMVNPRNWPGVISGTLSGSAEEVPMHRAIESFTAGHPVEAAGHYLAAGIPVLGPLVDSVGSHLGSANPEEMGRAVPEAASLAAMSPTARATSRTVGSAAGGAVGSVARHPVTTTLVGAGAGYLEGGWPGALRGAGGGGVIGVLNKIGDNMKRGPAPQEPAASKAPAGPVATPPSPPASRTDTGSASTAPGGPTNAKGNGFSMNVETKAAPKPQAKPAPKAETPPKADAPVPADIEARTRPDYLTQDVVPNARQNPNWRKGAPGSGAVNPRRPAESTMELLTKLINRGKAPASMLDELKAGEPVYPEGTTAYAKAVRQRMKINGARGATPAHSGPPVSASNGILDQLRAALGDQVVDVNGIPRMRRSGPK